MKLETMAVKNFKTLCFFQNHREIFDGIIEQMKQRVPGIGDIQPESTADFF